MPIENKKNRNLTTVTDTKKGFVARATDFVL